VEIERGAADAAQQAAFANADVGEMVNGLMLYPENRTLLEVARESFIRPTPATRDVLSARLRVDARDPTG
jgi:hypothetical protein